MTVISVLLVLIFLSVFIISWVFITEAAHLTPVSKSEAPEVELPLIIPQTIQEIAVENSDVSEVLVKKPRGRPKKKYGGKIKKEK